MLFAADYLPWDRVGSLAPINRNDGHFERCSNIETEVFCLVMNVGQRNPHHELNLRTLDSALQLSTMEPQGLYCEQGLLQSSCSNHNPNMF